MRLAQEVGGTITQEMDRFYGHTVPAPLAHEFVPADYLRLSMPFLSLRSIMLDRQGNRFIDESWGHYANARGVLHQSDHRALLIGDDQLRKEDSAEHPLNRELGFQRIDRPTEAAKAGAHVCEAATLEELGRAVEPWGYHNAAEGVQRFNSEIAGNADMAPPRRSHRRPLSPPFFAMEVQPAVSFTFGGLRVDAEMRVLRADDEPVHGLLAAGADVGGYYSERYSGGLGMASVLGLTATETALADHRLEQSGSSIATTSDA